MSMSKKDYVAVAAVFAPMAGEMGDSCCEAVVEDIANKLADVFAADNPRFDRAVFLKACGVA